MWNIYDILRWLFGAKHWKCYEWFRVIPFSRIPANDDTRKASQPWTRTEPSSVVALHKAQHKHRDFMCKYVLVCGASGTNGNVCEISSSIFLIADSTMSPEETI